MKSAKGVNIGVLNLTGGVMYVNELVCWCWGCHMMESAEEKKAIVR